MQTFSRPYDFGARIGAYEERFDIDYRQSLKEENTCESVNLLKYSRHTSSKAEAAA